MSLGKSINKYRTSGNGDEELFLSIFSCKPYSSNRKHSEPLVIQRPVLSLIGAIQPLVLGRLFDGNRSKNGFTHRFLFVYPDNVIREDLSDLEIPIEIEVRYQKIIKGLIGDLGKFNQTKVTPIPVFFSEEAMAVYKKVRKAINKIINEGASDNVSGIFAKLEIYYIRFCLILHVMYNKGSENEVPPEISEKTAEKAIKLFEYFSFMAQKVSGQIDVANDPLTRFSFRFREVLSQLPFEFSTSQAWEIFSRTTSSKKTMHNYLNQSDLFTKLDQGKYRREY